MISRYKELDSLRGIAALFVVFFHFTMDRPEAHLGFKLGVTGVDLFFIISGFVIFMSINKVSSTLEFIFNRVSRLYPTYWICVTITSIIIVIHKFIFGKVIDISFEQYFSNLTMFQNYLDFKDIDGPYWTMIIEMLFYIFIALLFAINKIKYVLHIGLTFVLFIVINDIWLEDYYINLKLLHVNFPLINHFPLFLAGIIFYKIIHLAKEDSNKTLYFYYSSLVFCYFTQLLLYDDGGRSYQYIHFHEYCIALFIYFALFMLFVKSKLSFIVSDFSLYIGKISFSLYLIHQYIGIRVVIPFLTNHIHLPFWISGIIAIIIVLAIATLITNFVEIPYSKKMNVFLKRIFLSNYKSIN